MHQVDLHAATSKARARSMQQIKQDKVERAAAYHRALAERTQLPRFLRLMDLHLRSALADMAASSVAGAVGTLRAAAPGLIAAAREPGSSDGDEEGPGMGGRQGPANARSQTVGKSATAAAMAAGIPVFACSVVFLDDASVGFSPSEAEWTAAVQDELVTSSLRLADGVLPLLKLPAFEHFQAGAFGEEFAQLQQLGAADLVQHDGTFMRAAGELQALLSRSCELARQQAKEYKEYLDIRRFDAEFDFEAWAE